ncbi:siderophore-iron reductase FhuF [Azospirillum sp. ST 5-10]|uniref:siderophore-iron reductase FhuF n=1 Tax=unclassified Azospirillum TaxID=2630922 RepID=UPI003F4A15E6
MTDEFAAVLSGPFAHLRGHVLPVGVGDADALPIRALFDGDRLDAVLERFARRYDGADRRAVLSMWSQWYLGLLIPPAAGTALLHGADRPLGFDDVRVTLAEGAPGTLHLPACRPAPSPAEPAARLAPLIRGHLAPFVTAFAGRTGVSPRLLWGNAAIRIAGVVEAACHRAGGPEAGARLREGLFGCRHWPDGERNPLFGGVRFPDGGAPQPRVCCLTYRLPGYGYCRGCPAPAADRK